MPGATRAAVEVGAALGPRQVPSNWDRSADPEMGWDGGGVLRMPGSTQASILGEMGRLNVEIRGVLHWRGSCC